MEITEKELIEIISEEIDHMVENDEIEENVLDRLKAQGAGAIARLNPLGDKGDAELRKASSLMKSYDSHLLKLAQKLQVDAQKLGIEDSKELQDIVSAMQAARGEVQQMALAAPRTMRDKARDARRDAARAKLGGPAPAAAPAAAKPAAAQPTAAAPAAAKPPAAQPTAAAPAAAKPAAEPAAAKPALDNRLQAWVDGGKKAGKITATQARTAMGTSRMTQKAGKYVFNSQPALQYAQQVAAALGDRAPSPLKKAIQDTIDTDAVNESTPLSAEVHQQLMSELDLWEQQYKLGGKETLEEQLQKISQRWGFGK